MEFLKQQWAQIRVYLEQMGLAEKWLVAAVVAVMLLAGSWLIFWAAQPRHAPIQAFSGAQDTEIVSRLNAAGIDARTEGGQVLVPVRQRDQSLSVLAQHDLLRSDTSQAFTELIEQQSPWQTDRQNQQAYLLAKQRVLGEIIGKMRGVQSANVIISMPQDRGFGRTHVQPSATVTVWMRGGERIGDDQVDAIAQLIAGAVAEMSPQDVAVTDGNFGRTRTVRDQDDVLPTDTLEIVQMLENHTRQKIADQLGYIRGVIVGVNVSVDRTQREVEEAFEYQEQEPLESQEVEEMTRRDVMEGGEPGARPNTGLDIAGGGGTQSEEETLRDRQTFREQPLTLRSHRTRSGHELQQINVSINVPRRYFVNIFEANNPDAEDPPDDAALQPIVEEHLELIQDQVEPLTLALEESVVRVNMIPDDSLAPTTATAGPTTFDQVLASDWARPVGIGALALASLALMVLMVRKATQREEELPSFDQLAGEAPAVEEHWAEDDDGSGALAGLEVDEHTIRSRQIAQQINDMVKSNPAEAGSLIGKWVRSR